jgi:hypothetical protein
MKEIVGNLVTKWKELSQNGETEINVSDYMNFLSLDIIALSGFNERMHNIENGSSIIHKNVTTVNQTKNKL